MLSLQNINIFPILESLVAIIRPFAAANDVRLQFNSSREEIIVYYSPESIIPDLTKVICRVITFTPQEYEVTLKVDCINPSEDQFLLVSIINSGVNLESVKKTILAGIEQTVSIIPLNYCGTKFVFKIPYQEPDDTEENLTNEATQIGNKYIIPPFYETLRTRLTSHFTSIRNLEKAASIRSQKEGVFLKKVNAVISAHIDNKDFNISSLSRAVALSRSQLYRRLKPLIRLAPSNYIRYVRLHKAKELIENDNLNVGEAAFRTGFTNHSHFSRAFREQFGFNPSELSRKQNI